VCSIDWSVTADVDEAVVYDASEIVTCRWENLRKNNTDFDQSF